MGDSFGQGVPSTATGTESGSREGSESSPCAIPIRRVRWPGRSSLPARTRDGRPRRDGPADAGGGTVGAATREATLGEPVPLLLELDRDRGVPLHRQLYDQLREAILEGRLKAGSRIPATRAMARELDISRTTVLTAVRRLMVEGFLEARVGAGTWVSESIREGLVGRSRSRPAEEDAARRGARRTSDRLALLRVHASGAPSGDGGRRPLQVGLPGLDAFPADRWARIAGRHWRRAGPRELAYASRMGLEALREAIAEYVGLSRGVRADPDRVLVTSGSQVALALAVQGLLDPGQRAWLEDPAYGGARGALVAAGARIVPVPVDEEGLDVAAGLRAAPAARLAYVTPSHQFPLGVTLSLERRLALLRWAEERDAWILEDDYDSEYRYEGRPLMSLQGLDGAGRVLYLGTFSKTLFPGLRLGFLVLPGDLVEPFAAARYFLDHHPPVPHQAALADFIGGGHLARHVRRMRDLYTTRRAALVEGIAARFGGRLEVLSSDAGLHLTARFLEPVDDVAVEAAARERGLGVLALSPFYGGERSSPGLVFGFGGTPVEEVGPALDELAAALAVAAPAAFASGRAPASPGGAGASTRE